MNILYLTISQIKINEEGLDSDLINCLLEKNHRVYLISPYEVEERENLRSFKIDQGSITKSKLIKKGISFLMIKKKFIDAIKRNIGNEKIDLILYATPPITLCNVINYCKKYFSAKTYLMLKDIFPQNAVDLNILKKKGIKGIIYKFFRNQEKKMYKLSDNIGCMSIKNIEYLLKKNTYINSEKVHLFPNSSKIRNYEKTNEEKLMIYEKFGIPQNKKVFVYGGNLGKPQDISFLIRCLDDNLNKDDRFFIISGSGTEYYLLEKFVKQKEPQNIKLFPYLPKKDFNDILSISSCGLVLLDYRFTIPNIPSRILSYMQFDLPIYAITDPNTDLRNIIINNNLGYWTPSNNVTLFTNTIDEICLKSQELIHTKDFLEKHYNIEKNINILLDAYYKNI